MSNLRSTGHLPLKTSMSNKWKAQAPTSELLERQTRALEESLNKLKIAMHSDKTKTSIDTNAPIWDKGKTGPLSQYASHILRDEPRRTFDANKPTKVRVLGDEPPATVNRPSLVANLFPNKPTTTTTTGAASKVVKCGQCEREEAKVKCLECAESYCTGCFAHFHLRGALQRHRCVPLTESRPATPQKKKPTVGADVIFKELRFAQSKDDLLRKSTVAVDMYEYIEDDIESETGDGGQLLNGNYDEKTSAASFQQALLAWRKGDEKKKPTGKSRRSTHEAAVDTVRDSNGELNQTGLPNIEFHSSNLTYGEKLLLKKYRRANKNHEDFFNHRTPLSKLPESIDLSNGTIEVEPLYDESARTITAAPDDDDNEEEELLKLQQTERNRRPPSRPNSAAMKKTPASSRPSSVALFQHPLPSFLATEPSDELKALTTDPHSRPSSASIKKPTKLDYRLPSIWNRNWKPEQSMSNGIDLKTVKVDPNSVAQFDAALDDLLDEDKLESASQMATPRPSTADIPNLQREKPIDSPFTFSHSPRKTDSSFSVDTGDGGFFTDVKPRKAPSSPRVVELRPVIPSLMSLRKASIESLSRAPPKRSTNLEDNRSQIDEQSRPGSSLSSSSLPVSITSSKPDLITRPSIERHPTKVVPQTTKKFRVEFSKKSSPTPPQPPPPVMVIEGKKVTSARNSARDSDDRNRTKISSGIQPLKASTATSFTTITRDGSITLTDLPANHKNKARKIEFTVKDGIKWQNASTDLRRSSKANTPRPSTPSNPNNSKLGQQFSSYDNDDGRSSRACQDVDDEECFNQLHEELCSELGTASPGWDASLSEHVLKNLRGTEVRYSEKDLQDNLTLLETKLREAESLQRSQTDDDLSVHEEIRNL